MSKVSARWVPRLLKDNEKDCRVRCSQAFLSRYDAEGDEFLDRIITTDETGLHHFDPETNGYVIGMENPAYTSSKESPGAEKCGKTHVYFLHGPARDDSAIQSS